MKGEGGAKLTVAAAVLASVLHCIPTAHAVDLLVTSAIASPTCVKDTDVTISATAQSCYAGVSGGVNHSAGVLPDTSAVTWGDCNLNQCAIPAPNTGFVKVSAGGFHTLGLKEDGTLVVWGSNNWGQSNTPSPNSGFIDVAAGIYHNVALKADGSVIVWGGEGGSMGTPSPNTGFVAIAAGRDHSLALKADGSIVAWGSNAYGQLNVPSPNTGFVAISSKFRFSLGLKADGSIVAWGDNTYGQCNVPSPNFGFVAMSAGGFHGMALKADGSIVTWGRNDKGQCNVPLPNTGFASVSGGISHSLAIKTDGTALGWGLNDAGQSAVPTIAKCAPLTWEHKVGGGSWAAGLVVAAAELAEGANTLYVRATDACGNVSDPFTVATPVTKDTTPPIVRSATASPACVKDTDVTISATTQICYGAVSGGVNHSAALLPDSSAVTWGDCGLNQCMIPAPNTGFVKVSAGGFHTLGLREDGTLVVWGSNNWGQSNTPSPNSGFIDVAAGIYHNVALKADGSVIVWGGEGGSMGTPSPNTGFVAIAAGRDHSLALKADGSIVAWGSNAYGQLNVPSPNTGFVAISSNFRFSLAMKADGSIVAWGDNTYGQCNVPSPNIGFVAMSAGGFHGMGLKADGSIVTWGRNNSGQCNVPLPNTGFAAISAGSSHSLAIKTDGTALGWGLNDAGQSAVPTVTEGTPLTWEHKIGGGSWAAGLVLAGAELAEGGNTLYVRATDACANVSDPFTVATPVTKDTIPPTIGAIAATQSGNSVLCPATALVGTVDIYVTVTNDAGCGGLLQPSVEVADIGAATYVDTADNVYHYTVTITTTTASGSHAITVTVSDDIGNMATDDSTSICVNAVPVVDADPDQTVYEGRALILHAAASDADGDPLTYLWTQTTGLAVVLDGAATANATFTSPTVTSLGEAGLTFQVTVSDGKGGTASDSVNVRVRMMGDINPDDSVDVVDLLMFVDAFGSVIGDPNYDPLCDLNPDGSVDVVDLLTFVENFGRAF